MKAFSTLVAALVLMLPTGAAAKGGHDAQLCGQDGCVVIDAPAQLRALAAGAVAPTEAPPTSDFYVLNFGIGELPEYFSVYYVPEAGALAANGPDPGALTWLEIAPQLESTLRQASFSILPYAGPSAWPFELKSPGRIAARVPGSASGGVNWMPLDWLLAGMLLLSLAGLALPRRKSFGTVGRASASPENEEMLPRGRRSHRTQT